MPVILPDARLFYADVPKVACTSLKHLFFEAENGFAFRPFRINGGPIRHIHNLYPPMLREKYPEARLQRFDRFCVVRDPIRRFLSAYGNRVRAHRELSPEKAGANLKALGLTADPDLDLFIDRLEDYTQAHVAIAHHTRPMVDFLGHDPGYFTRVYPMEALDDFCREINTRLGTDLSLPRLQTGGPKFKPDVLTAAQTAKLKAYYREDYAAFGAFLD